MYRLVKLFLWNQQLCTSLHKLIKLSTLCFEIDTEKIALFSFHMTMFQKAEYVEAKKRLGLIL